MSQYLTRRHVIYVVCGLSAAWCSLFVCALLFVTPKINGEIAEVRTSDMTSEAENEAVQLTTSATDTLPSATPSSTETATATIIATEKPNSNLVSVEESATSVLGYSPESIETAVVQRIIDGDTIEVLIDGKSERVRYIGVDTPEQEMSFANEATELNAQLVAGQTIYMIRDISERDRYDRLLRYVFLADGTFVNGVLVEQGVAQAVAYEPDVAAQSKLIELQEEAQEANFGLWEASPTALPTNSPSPVPPTETAVMPSPSPTATTIPPTSTAVPIPPTATAASPPTAVPQPTQPPPPPEPQVIISNIFYDGVEPRSEGDEYAVISNVGNMPVNLAGWRLNAGDAGQDFNFPSFELSAGASCRVYTNQVHGDSCGGGSFGSGRAIWNNKGECGYLYNASNVEVSTRCY